MFNKKYLGELIPVLTRLKNKLIDYENLMEEISMEDVKKMWELKGADGSTVQMDLSWVASQESVTNVQNEIIEIKKIIKDIKSEVAPDAWDCSPEGEIDNWNYELDSLNNAVVLLSTKSTIANDILIYNKYLVGGVKYNTIFRPTDKIANSSTLSITFAPDVEIQSLNYLFKDVDKSIMPDIILIDKNMDLSKLTSMQYTFYGAFSSFDDVKLDKFASVIDTSNVTNMSHMFYRVGNPSSIDVTGLNTSNVTDMSYMFNLYYSSGGTDKSKVTSLNISTLDTHNVTNMEYMFSDSISLESLNLTNFDTSSVTNMRCMFGSCKSLTSLDLTSWNISSVTDMYCMFAGCINLTEILVSRDKWVIPEGCNTTDMFANCGCSEVTYVD